MGRVILVFVGLIWSTCAWAQPAPAPAAPSAGPDLELAKAHYRTGEIYYERGRYPDAAREFEEAYRLSNRPELLYNMGKSYDGVGDQARALAAYRRFLAQVKESPDRATVSERVAQLSKLVGHITVQSPIAGAQVQLDGAPVGETPLPEPLEVNPGGHRLEVAKEGYRTLRQTVVATPGGALTFEAKLESLIVEKVRVVEVERKVPTYKKWWIWSLVGAVVVAGAVTGGVLGAREPPVSGDYAQLPAVK